MGISGSLALLSLWDRSLLVPGHGLPKPKMTPYKSLLLFILLTSMNQETRRFKVLSRVNGCHYLAEMPSGKKLHIYLFI